MVTRRLLNKKGRSSGSTLGQRDNDYYFFEYCNED